MSKGFKTSSSKNEEEKTESFYDEAHDEADHKVRLLFNLFLLFHLFLNVLRNVLFFVTNIMLGWDSKFLESSIVTLKLLMQSFSIINYLSHN